MIYAAARKNALFLHRSDKNPWAKEKKNGSYES